MVRKTYCDWCGAGEWESKGFVRDVKLESGCSTNMVEETKGNSIGDLCKDCYLNLRAVITKVTIDRKVK